MDYVKSEVYKFLQEWMLWHHDGASGGEYKRYYGLCDNLNLYAFRMAYANPKASCLRSELRRMLEEDGLDVVFPFNDDMGDTYGCEVRNLTCHMNMLRVQWVIQRVSRGKAEGYLC